MSQTRYFGNLDVPLLIIKVGVKTVGTISESRLQYFGVHTFV
jgi:hypothetical protein